MEKAIIISRQTLYEQVWSKPLIHLAKEYQLSDVGLAKICRRNNIPLPPVGYWSKIAHGQAMKRTPLPTWNENEPDQIEIAVKDQSLSKELVSKENLINQISREIGHDFVTLSEFKVGFHPLIVNAQKDLRDRLKSYRIIDEGMRIHFLNISVTRSSTERALSLMNMLFQIAEANNLPISCNPGYKAETFVKVNRIDVQVELKERTKRSDNPDPKSDNKYIFHPTGILYFELTNIYQDGAKKIWNDTHATKLEEVVHDVVSGIVIAAILRKKRDEEWEESRKKEEQGKALQRLIEEQKKTEQERVHALFKDAQQWQASNTVREYIKAVEDRYGSVLFQSEEKLRLEEWIRWANQNADLNDPTLDQPWKKN